MKLKFKGWRREVKPHEHAVAAVVEKVAGFSVVKGPLRWEGLSTYGKVDRLSLTGAFLVEMSFTKADLRNWLRMYAKSDPAEALRLVAELQGEALIAIARDKHKT